MSRVPRQLFTARLCARLLLGVAGAAAISLAAPEVWAQPKKAEAKEGEAKESRQIAIVVEGEDADSMRGAIMAIVPETLQVVEPDDFEKALKKQGAKPPLAKAIADKRQRDKTITRIRKAAKAAKVDAVVVGVVRKAGAKKELVLLFIDQKPGDLSVDDTIPLRGSEADHLRSIDAALGPVLREIAPEPAKEEEEKPPPKEEKPPPKEEEKEPAGARPKHQFGREMLVGELGLEIGGRFFGYKDALTANLRPYNVFGQPLLALGVEFYPLAGSTTPVVKDLGLTLAYARALGLSSETEDGALSLPTTYQRFSVGLRGRINVGEGAEAIIVGVSGGLRLLQFELEAPAERPDLAAELPNVSYTLLRLGVDVRAPVGPVAILGGLEYLAPVSYSGAYERLTDPSVGGTGLNLGVAVPITPGIEGRVMLEYMRFFSSFTPLVGDPYVAGGALDHFLGIRFGGAYVY